MAVIERRGRKVIVECDEKYSDKCRGKYEISFSNYTKQVTKDNKTYCKFCKKRYLSAGNPNRKYQIDPLFFDVLDEKKAYLLGWIASDGHVNKSGFSIGIKISDIEILQQLRDVICKELPLTTYKDERISLYVNSKQISEKLCKLLNITPGKKSDIVEFPNLETNLAWSFLRGYFDGDGTISYLENKTPRCSIKSSSPKMLAAIQNFCGIKCHIYDDIVVWYGNNCLDFLSKLYDNTNIKLRRKYELYCDWSTWVPSLSGNGNHGKEIGIFSWAKSDSAAVPPTKNRASDLGYDLTIIKEVKRFGKVILYDTGIKVQPEHGVFFMMAPRSSISKTGYMMANSVGIIDKSYIGNIMVPLIKVDETAPELELPCRIAQLIPMPGIHLVPIEVESLDDTERAEKGFGSSGK